MRNWPLSFLCCLLTLFSFGPSSSCVSTRSIPPKTQPPKRQSLPSQRPPQPTSQKTILHIFPANHEPTTRFFVVSKQHTQYTLALWQHAAARNQLLWKQALDALNTSNQSTLDIKYHHTIALLTHRHPPRIEARSIRDGNILWRKRLPLQRQWSPYIRLWTFAQTVLFFTQNQQFNQQYITQVHARSGTQQWQKRFTGTAFHSPQPHTDFLFVYQSGKHRRIHLKTGALLELPASSPFYRMQDKLWSFRWEPQSQRHLWSFYDHQRDQLRHFFREKQALALHDMHPQRSLIGLHQHALWIGNTSQQKPSSTLRIHSLRREKRSKLSLPQGYVLSSFRDQWGRVSPQHSAFRVLNTRFFPLWVTQNQPPHLKKLLILDLQRKTIHWQSQPIQHLSSFGNHKILRDQQRYLIHLPWDEQRAVFLMLE
ncbi:MAG: hypothetical protein AAGJ35_06160, partial [Myxococcota bacterium]